MKWVLSDFVAAVFAALGLEWDEWVDTDPSLFRAGEVKVERADPSMATKELGWAARLTMRETARRLALGQLD